MDIKKLKNILEAVLLASDKTLSVIQLEGLFELDEERPTRDEIRQALHEMTDDYETRGYELKQVASGFRLQVRQEFSTWVGRLWEERPARYTRALLETMSLIAYRQPITRGEIEEVRGVSVSSNIIKTLLERDWVKVLGHKDVPGKPSLYGTTKEFLDYFNLKSLDELPTLAEIKDLDSIHPELALDENSAEHVEDDSEEADQNAEDSVATEAVNDGENVAVDESIDEPEMNDEDVVAEDVSEGASEYASDDITEETTVEEGDSEIVTSEEVVVEKAGSDIDSKDTVTDDPGSEDMGFEGDEREVTSA